MAMAVARNTPEAPDSGIGRTQDSKTRGGSVGWCNQSIFQQTIPRPIRRKRRAGGRMVTVSDAGPDVGSEGPCGVCHASEPFLVLEGQHSVSSVSDVAEAQPGWPLDDE